MPKRIYQLGEPCDKCQTPTVQGKMGAYCKPCYIAYKEGQKQTGTWTPPVTINAPQASFDPNYKALEEKVATLEMALANMRVWAAKVEQRLSGVETLNEGKALDLHQSFPVRDIHEAKAIVEDGIPVINSLPEGFER